MKRQEVERADFDKLIARLRKRGIAWSTWQIAGTRIMYSSREHRRIVKQEIEAL